MSFIETRFPDDISYGSSGGPGYSTSIVATDGGYEKRNVRWQQARTRYNVAHGVKNLAQLEALIAFFRARKGRAFGFRFKDWSDFQGIGQSLGSGDGTRTQFQLIKSYSSGGVSETRIIHKPVAGSVKIYRNSVLVSSGVTTSTSNGMVQFSTPPANGVLISADFEFDVPVRFDTDSLSASLDAYGVHSWQDIALVEVRI
ncbi:MAG: DUF2460 domain-containing protein [Rickettsiales bacterium]|nr:DUF2460 domain-containing protein [Rickettsiales bacterium]